MFIRCQPRNLFSKQVVLHEFLHLFQGGRAVLGEAVDRWALGAMVGDRLGVGLCFPAKATQRGRIDALLMGAELALEPDVPLNNYTPRAARPSPGETTRP